MFVAWIFAISSSCWLYTSALNPLLVRSALIRSKMRDSDDVYGLAVLGAVDRATGAEAAIGIAQPATMKATTAAARFLVTRIHVISPRHRDRSSASRRRRGSRRVRLAVNTR